MRIVRTVLIFDQIKDQFVGDCAHCAVPPLRFPTATTPPQELPSLRRICGLEACRAVLRILPLDNYFFVNIQAREPSFPLRIHGVASKA
jgi:hypothetical protein